MAWWLLLACVSSTADPTDTESAPATGGSETESDSDNPDVELNPGVWVEWDPADFATVYEVGPDEDYLDPSEVPWESLEPDTLVRIHPRESPYATKFSIAVEATEDAPVVITGVPDADGTLPVLDGEDATTRLELDYWNEARSVIKIGGTSAPSGVSPAHIVVQGLEITGAHEEHTFTDDAGNPATYSDNAACIHLEEGEHITLRGNILHGCGNGLFVGSTSGDVLVTGNTLYGNGNVGSYYEHNSYTQSDSITFEFNRYGPLCDGCDGNNLKDRSAVLVVRYNLIEGGNRQLDLVDGYGDTLEADGYGTAWVHGNLLWEPDDDGNSQIVHFGGDSGDTSLYRSGTLHFYDNTVVSGRSGNTTLLLLSTAEQSAELRNNIVVADSLALSAGQGDLTLRNNWLSSGWRDTFEGSYDGTIDESDTLEGTDPGFSGSDFHLAEDSVCVDAAGPLAEGVETSDFQYLPDADGVARPTDGAPDLGAFEREAIER